jgi:hypothetical protein
VSQPTNSRHLVFICFRSSDGGSYASVYLDSILPATFGAANVFRSSRSIPAGAPFPSVIEDALRKTRVLLVLIGPDWLRASTGDGTRVIDQPGDWVRHEIAVSLRAGIPVIPVLLTGAALPARAELPADIADLGDRQAVHLRHRHIDVDAGHLIEQLRLVAPDLGGGVGPAGQQRAERPGGARRDGGFGPLIAEKNRGFVGREHVFRAVEEWLAANRSGYLTLRAEPGYGKSAIVAQYAQRTGCVAYFNQRAVGRTSARQYLAFMRQQLGDGDGTLGADGSELAELLGQAAPRSPGERLLVAVDALDEVDLDVQDRGSNVLYLPPQLPDGVYFLLTKRDVALPLVVDVPAHTLDLMAPRFSAANLDDARAYLERSASLAGVDRWIRRQGLARSVFVDELARRSAANFMYLHHVVQDIEAGRLDDRDVGAMPEGLRNYYADHWHRMGMDAVPPPLIKLRVLYVLLEYAEPLTVRALAGLIGEKAALTASILREWSQFMRKDDGPSGPVYSLYHESFADFLRHEEVLAASGIDLAEINGLIADQLYETR